MKISEVIISNFKGIKEETHIELRPYTLFIGPNSSGKSTVIHALAALAQTSRQPNDTRPLILDDELAQIHLGRFIEIVHTHSYEDCIKLGVGVDEARFRSGKKDGSFSLHTAHTTFDFRSTVRTQEIQIEKGEAAFDDHKFQITRKGKVYTLRSDRLGSMPVTREAGFTFKNIDAARAADYKFDHYYDFIRAQNAVIGSLKSVHYLGPFRMPPQRRYQTRGSEPFGVGTQGENTVTILANEILKTRSRKLITQIGKWLDVLGIAKKIETIRVGGSDLFELIITLNDGKKLPIADLGYGISQVLPVLTQCAFPKPYSTLLFEQPELHLHPLAQKPLANVFINARELYGHQLLLETHSRELFFEFISAIRDGRIKLNDFIAYRVTRTDSKTKLEKIKIEAVQGDVDIFTNWQVGFCSEI